ncbi:MAG: hypothetical protein AABY32_02395 [Nanoarchaeota archaeon]
MRVESAFNPYYNFTDVSSICKIIKVDGVEGGVIGLSKRIKLGDEIRVRFNGIVKKVIISSIDSKYINCTTKD